MKRLETWTRETLRALRQIFSRRPCSRPRSRLAIELLEGRALPSGSPWVQFRPMHHDAVDRLISQVLPSSRGGVQFFENVSAWIYHSFSSGVPAVATANGGLISLAGSCGVRDDVMREVAARLHVPARRVSLFNVPVQLGHTITEVFVGKAWHVFDPTFGIILTRPGSHNPLSLAAARDAFPHVSVQQALTAASTGIWSKQSTYAYGPAPNLQIASNGSISADARRTYFLSQALGGDLRANPAVWTQIDTDRAPASLVQTAVARHVRTLRVAGAATIGHTASGHVEADFVLLASRRTSVTFTVLTSARLVPTLYADSDPLAYDRSYTDTIIRVARRRGAITFQFVIPAPGTVLRLTEPLGHRLDVVGYRWQLTAAALRTTVPAGAVATGSVSAKSTARYLPPYFLDLGHAAGGHVGEVDRADADLLATPLPTSYGTVNAVSLYVIGQRYAGQTAPVPAVGQQFLLHSTSRRVVWFTVSLVQNRTATLRADVTALTADGEERTIPVAIRRRGLAVTFRFRVTTPLALLRIDSTRPAVVDAYEWTSG